ncbi:hypothetical protein BGX21_004581, partial [Mortierella sp. AD011]
LMRLSQIPTIPLTPIWFPKNQSTKLPLMKQFSSTTLPWTGKIFTNTKQGTMPQTWSIPQKWQRRCKPSQKTPQCPTLPQNLAPWIGQTQSLTTQLPTSFSSNIKLTWLTSHDHSISSLLKCLHVRWTLRFHKHACTSHRQCASTSNTWFTKSLATEKIWSIKRTKSTSSRKRINPQSSRQLISSRLPNWPRASDKQPIKDGTVTTLAAPGVGASSVNQIMVRVTKTSHRLKLRFLKHPVTMGIFLGRAKINGDGDGAAAEAPSQPHPTRQ